jgi:hypothetical protein
VNLSEVGSIEVTQACLADTPPASSGRKHLMVGPVDPTVSLYLAITCSRLLSTHLRISAEPRGWR